MYTKYLLELYFLEKIFFKLNFYFLKNIFFQLLFFQNYLFKIISWHLFFENISWNLNKYFQEIIIYWKNPRNIFNKYYFLTLYFEIIFLKLFFESYFLFLGNLYFPERNYFFKKPESVHIFSGTVIIYNIK